MKRTLLPLLSFLAVQPAVAANRVWDGGDATANLSVSLNWNPNAVPVAGDDLTFPAGPAAPDRTVSNNFPANTQFTGLSFNGAGYTFGGTILKLTGSLNAGAAGVTQFNGGVSWDGQALITASNGADLRFGAASQIYGPAGNSTTVSTFNNSIITVDGVFSQPGSVLFFGDGQTKLHGAKSLHNAVTIIGGGQVGIDHGNGLGTSAAAGRVEVNGSSLSLNSGAAQTFPRDLLFSGTNPTLYTQGSAHTWSGDIEIGANGHRYLEVLSGSLSLSGVISSDLASPGVLIKRGPGTMHMDGPAGNTFMSTFRIEEGEIRLNKPGFNKFALSTDYVQISNTGRILLDAHSQINPDATVAIFDEGLLDLQNHAQRLKRLHLYGGTQVETGADLSLVVSEQLLVLGPNGASPASLNGRVMFNDAASRWTVYDFEGTDTEFVCHAALLKNPALGEYTAAVLMDGTGNMELQGDHDIDAITYAGTGTLKSTGGESPDTDLTLASGTLRGDWEVQNFHATGGTVNLYDAAQQQRIICDNCTFETGSRYEVTLEQVNQDYILAFDSITLNNADLAVTLPGADPAPGTEYMLLRNGSTEGSEVSGQFAGKPEGTMLGGSYLLSYQAGSSNSVTITFIVPPTGVTRTWDGGGGNNNWSTAANWSGNILPQQGDALLFPSVAQRKTNVNDLPAGTSFQSITVGSGDYSISGAKVYLNSDLRFAHNSGTPVWNVPVEFTLPASVRTELAGVQVNSVVHMGNNHVSFHKGTGPGELVLAGIIQGISGSRLIASGPGDVRLLAANSFIGSTFASAGRLIVTSAGNVPDVVWVDAGGELRLDGGGAAISLNNTTFLAGLLSVAPGPACENLGPFYIFSDQSEFRTDGAFTCRSAVFGGGTLRKSGASTLTFNHGTAEGIAGGMFIDEGEVRIAMTLADSFTVTPVVIGSNGLPARLTLTGSNHIGDDVEVQVHPSGTFDAATFTDTFGALTMTGGSVTGTSASPLILKSGQLTTHASAAPAVITARLAAAAGVTGKLTIADGAPSPDLSIQSRVYGALFEKTGTGRVDFTVSQPVDAFDKLDLKEGSAFFFSNSQHTAIALNGGTLGGHGTVGEIISGASGGLITPGASPGVLGGYKAVWNAATTLRMELNGLNPGAEYDQYSANGLTDLGSAHLEVTAGFDPAPGDSFMIIRNVSGLPVSGTFTGLPQNGYVSAPGAKVFQINYTGGDGDDVMLTRMEVSPPEIVTYTMTPGANPGDDSNAHFVFKGTPGLIYRLQSSTDLEIWQNLQSAAADLLTGQIIMDLAEPAADPRKFYRLTLP